MKYGDFSSLVQLGVGLHAGTALLQLFGEFGLQPIERQMARIKDVLEDEEGKSKSSELSGKLSQLDAELAIFRIKLFNEYKKYVRANFGIAAILVLCLVIISFVFDYEIDSSVAILFAALSCLPAPITLFSLWVDASKEVKPLRKRIVELEDAVVAQ